MTKKISYFNTSSMMSAGYYLSGLSVLNKRFDYRLCYPKELPEEIFEVLSIIKKKRKATKFVDKNIGNPHFEHLFQVENKTSRFLFCIDASDQSNQFNSSILKKVKYYFKVNHNPNNLPDNENSHKIHPINPWFPVRPNFFELSSSNIFPSKLDYDDSSQLSGGGLVHLSLYRLNQIRKLPSLNHIKKLRNIPKKWDIFFALTYYEEEHHQKNNEYRYQLMRSLSSLDDLNILVGFAGKHVPYKYREFHIDTLEYKDYLRTLAESRIGIYVSGLHDCLSVKLPTMLALGLPIVGTGIINNRYNLMQNNFFANQFSYKDPEKIARKAFLLSKKSQLLEKLGKSNSNIFDSFLSPERTISQILRFMKI